MTADSTAVSSSIKGPTIAPISSQNANSPNPTLYVNNLNTKIKKPELKRLLYHLFSPYGQILSVVASKAPSAMRGQAFIVFKEMSSAVVAMRALQGYPFYEKSLRIQYARTKSQATKEMEMILSGSSVQYTRKDEQVELFKGEDNEDEEEFE